MSKAVKGILTIVGIAALAVTGIGLFVAPSALGALAGVSAAANAIGLSTLASIGFASLALGTTPEFPSQDRTGASSRGRAFANPNALGAFVFGRTLAPSVVVYEERHGVNNDRITDVFAHAWHRIGGYVSLTIGAADGPETITFSGGSSTGPGAWSGLLEWHRQDGAQTTAITISEQPGGEFDWPSTAIGEGVAHSAIAWNLFRDPDGEKITGGVPRDIEIVVDGAFMYDPRLDPAYGSGTQDFDDPDTWSYPSTNPGNAALVALRFLIGERSPSGDLIWGRGASESEIIMDTFVAMANVADEALDGGFRYSLAGMHLLNGDWEGFVKRWEQETGGTFYKQGGRYGIWLPHDDLTPSTTITEDDLVEGAAIGHAIGNFAEFYNTVRGRYIEPDEGYRGFPYPEVSEASAISQDGEVRLLSYEFSWIQSRSLAERIAREILRRSRFQRIWVIPMGWKGQSPDYAPFTVHNLNVKETNKTNQIVRVLEQKRAMNGATVLVVREEDASIYDDTLPLGTAFTSGGIPSRLDRLGTVTPRFVGSLNLETNVELNGSANAHDAILYGFTGGTPNRDVDGFIFWNGARVTIERAQAGNNTIATNDSDTTSVGWIAFDTAKANPFTVFSTAVDVAFVRKVGDQWQYDSNSAWVNFTPTATMVALGWMEKGASGIANAGLFGQPIALELAPGARTRHGADVTSEQSVNGCENPEFEAGPTGWETTTGWEIVQDANKRSGSWCLKLTGAVNFIFNSRDMQVSPGDVVQAYIHGKRTAGTTGTIQVGVEFRDSSGVAITGPQGNTVSASSYAQSRVVGVAPANAVTATLFIDCDATDDSFGGYVDGCGMHIVARASDDIYRQATAPAHAVGRIWIDTDDLRIYRSDGANWVQIGADDPTLASNNATAEGGADVTGNNTSADTNSEADTFTVTGDPDDFFGTVDGDCQFTRTGETVTLRFPNAIIGTSESTFMNFSGIPGALRPTTGQSMVVFPLVDNSSGAVYFGRMRIETTGDFSFLLMKPNGTYIEQKSFTASGTKGIGAGLQVTYSMS